jgi:hypothetical protein
MNFLTALIAGASMAMALTVPESGTMLKGKNGRDVLLISKTMNRKDAERVCQAAGGQLANLQAIEDIEELGRQVSQQAWIGGFLNHKSAKCVALYPGGAVAEPIGSCNALHNVLCQ